MSSVPALVAVLSRVAMPGLVSVPKRIFMVVAGVVAVVVVGSISLFATSNFPQRAHLSLIAQDRAEETLVVTSVMLGGLAYDAGVRAGDIIVGFEGGRLEGTSGHRILRDPSQIDVAIAPEGVARHLDAQDLYWLGQVAPPLMAIVALTFVVMGAGLLYLRLWDPVTWPAFLFFLSMGIVLSLGIFSGAWGGPIPVFVQGVALLSAGATLVVLMQGFPNRTVPAQRWLLPVRWLVLFAASVLLVLHALAIGPSNLFIPLTRAATGAFLVACLVIATGEFFWLYRHADSPVRRRQFQIAALSVILGLAPTFLLLIAPQLIFGKVRLLPVEIALGALVLIPIGWAYTLVEPGINGPRERLHRAFTMIVALVGGFVFATGLAKLVNGLLYPRAAELDPTRFLLIGLLSAAMVGVGFLAARGRVTAEMSERARQDLLDSLRRGPLELAERPAALGELDSAVPLEIKQEARQLVNELRRLLGDQESSAEEVSSENWLTTLQQLATGLERSTGIAASVLAEERQGSAVSGQIGTVLVYAVREVLRNIAQDSQASECVIRFYIERDTIHLGVYDNGPGIAQVRLGHYLERAGFGLRFAKARIEALGGTITVSSPGGVGTQHHIAIPLQ